MATIHEVRDFPNHGVSHADHWWEVSGVWRCLAKIGTVDEKNTAQVTLTYTAGKSHARIMVNTRSDIYQHVPCSI